MSFVVGQMDRQIERQRDRQTDRYFLILLYKVVRFFSLKLMFSITTEPVEFSIVWKLHIEPEMASGFLESSLRWF